MVGTVQPMRFDPHTISSFLAGALMCSAVAGVTSCLAAPLLDSGLLWTLGKWLIAPFLVCLVLVGSVAGIGGAFYNVWRVGLALWRTGGSVLRVLREFRQRTS